MYTPEYIYIVTNNAVLTNVGRNEENSVIIVSNTHALRIQRVSVRGYIIQLDFTTHARTYFVRLSNYRMYVSLYNWSRWYAWMTNTKKTLMAI
jgi:hypothetical protein